MAGLLDLFGGGDNTAPNDGIGALYGGLLSPQALAALRQRQIDGFAAGMAKAGPTTTAPFLTHTMPADLGQVLGSGAAGALAAQDSGVTNALNAQLVGLQGAQLAQKLALGRAGLAQNQQIMQRLFGGGVLPGQPGSAAGPSTAGPGGQDSAAQPMEAGGELTGASVSGSLSPADVKQLAYQAGFKGDDADKATAIVMAESSGNPNAANENGEHSYGLSQINADAWGPIAKTALGNPAQAMRLMYQISQGGSDFSPWSTFKNGAYKQYLGDAQAPAPTPLLSGNALPPGPQLASAAPMQPGLLGGPSPAAISAGAVPPLAQPQSLMYPQPAGGAPSAAPAPTPAPGAPALVPGGALSNLDRAVIGLGLMNANKGLTGQDYTSLLQGLQQSPYYQGQVAGAKKQAELPYTPQTLRPGGVTGLYDANGNFRPSYTAPTLQQSTDAAGNKQFVYMTPQGAQPTGIAAGIGPEVTARAKQTGKNEANLGPTLSPGAASAATGGEQPALTGSPLAKGLNSTIPDYKEPMLSAKELESSIPSWRQKSAEATAAIGQSQFAENQLANIANAFKQIQTGAYTTNKAEFNAALMSIFGKDTGLQLANASPKDVELALHENYRQTLQTLAAANKRFAQSEFLITSENSEHPDLQPEANLHMLGEDIGRLRQMQAMGNDWLTAQQNGKHNFDAFEASWLKANPMSKIVPAVTAEIGPLGGMPGGPGSKPAAEAAIPPMSRVVNGITYISPDGGKTWFK